MLCVQCNQEIPTKIIIDSIPKTVSNNRIYCFQCKPFGSKGRTNSGPTAKTMKNYKNWPVEWKQEHQAKVRLRGDGLKQQMIDLKGGSCIVCGYNKCLRALTFHHRNPELKSFNLDKESILRKTWDQILTELEKCDLLCANCHFELEDKLVGRQGVEPCFSA